MESHWHEFLRSRPGRRFQEAHARHQESERRSHGVLRWLLIAAGVLLTLAGVVLLAFPGPGLLVALAGVGLIAREFLGVARALDKVELWLRPVFKRVRRWWRRTVRSRPWVIWVGGVLGVCGVAGAMVLGWWVMR